jgi:DNA replication protein DnaC
MSHIVRTSIPKLHRDWDIKDLFGATNTEDIQQKVAKYLADPRVLEDGNNLYIYSPVNGNGKSRIANYVLQELHKPRLNSEGRGVITPIAQVKFGEYLISRNQFTEDAIADRKLLMTVPILLLDDVSPAFCSNNPHTDKRELTLLVSHRREDQHVTIITSNLVPVEFEKMFGMTAASKVLENFSFIEIQGEDVRDIIYPDKLVNEILERGDQ